MTALVPHTLHAGISAPNQLETLRELEGNADVGKVW